VDTEVTGATSGIGHDQALQGLDGGVHRVPAISLVGKGVDSEDQTVAGELAWGKGPPMASTEIESIFPMGREAQKYLQHGKAQSNPRRSPQGFLGTSPSMRPTWQSLTLTRMLSKVSRALVHAVGGMGKHSCL
jgi:hypothetical protein